MTPTERAREEAEQQYAEIINKVECPLDHCKVPVGKLCDTVGVWVHMERFRAADPINYPVELFT